MSQVSVASVDELSDALGACESAVTLLANACIALERNVAALVERCHAEVEAAAVGLDAAVQRESEARQTEAEAEHALAEDSSAVDSVADLLSSCRCSGTEEDPYPDCSGEESALIDAENQLAESQRSLDAATQATAEASAHRAVMEERLEGTRSLQAEAEARFEALSAEQRARLGRCQDLLEAARARFTQARQALDAYLAAHPAAADFVKWLWAKPKSGQPLTTLELNRRLTMTPQMHREFMAYLAERDPQMKRMIQSYRERLAACAGAEDVHRLQIQMRKNFSGLYAEKVVEYALRPWAGAIHTQVTAPAGTSGQTRTDLIVTGLTGPVILGKGEGMAAPAGGSLAVEVKTGSAAYLYAQIQHMTYQAQGHSSASASVVICSRDIKDLQPTQRKALREAMRKAGSPIIGMLPHKAQIDTLCWEAITSSGPNQTQEA